MRWCIEIFFPVLKNGCQIERLPLETEDRLLPYLALYMIIAWRVLFTLMLGRACPDIDCEVIFDRQEWQAAYIVVKRCPPPQNPPRRYGSLAIGLHWLMFLLMVGLYACIELRVLYPKGSDPREALKMWHFLLGLSVGLLV